MDLRTVGVEEEFLLVEREGGHPRVLASAVLRAARGKLGDQVAAEMQLEQVETETQPCVSR
jgi:glutamate---cysteine ligase / carboxylate-amine ligase